MSRACSRQVAGRPSGPPIKKHTPCSSRIQCSRRCASSMVDHCLPRPSRAITRWPRGTAPSSEVPSLWRSISGSEFFERFESGNSFNSRARPRGNRRAYSCHAVCTQPGIRWPTAATVSCTREIWNSGRAARAAALLAGRFPQFLEIVKSPRLREHQMNDDIVEIHQDPFGLSFPLYTERLTSGGLGVHDQFFGH